MDPSEAQNASGRVPKCDLSPMQLPPNTSEVIQLLAEIGPGAFVYMSVPIFLFAIMTIIYVEEAIFILKTNEFWKRTQLKLWVLSAFPVLSALCVVSIFFPRSTPTISVLLSFYNALCMQKYAELVLHYYGGTKKMAVITNEIVVKSTSFPCIICCCVPDIKMNVKNIKIMLYLIYPVTIFQPIMFLILNVLWNEELQFTALAPLLTVFQLTIPFATFVAVYGFVILNAASKGALRHYRIRMKFVTIQLIMAIGTIQAIILVLMDFARALPCTFPYPNPKPGYLLHTYIFPFELFILSIAARWAFRVSESGLEPIPEPRSSHDSEMTEQSHVRSEADTDSDYRSQTDSFGTEPKVITTMPVSKGERPSLETDSPARLKSFKYFPEEQSDEGYEVV